LILTYQLSESPRFLLLKGQHEKAFDTINEMIKYNNKDCSEQELNCILLSDFEKKDLANWATGQNQQNPEGMGQIAIFKAIFSGGGAIITICIWYMWFYNGFIYNGLTYSLPLILESIALSTNPNHIHNESQEDLLKIFYITLAEIPAAIFVFFMIENKNFGRKYTILLSAVFTAIFSLLTFLSDSKSLLYICIGTKISQQFSYLTIYPLTSEVYPTFLRSTGFGLATCMKRIATIIMPWMILGGIQTDIHKPFLVFSFLALGGVGAALLLPYDTVGMELDHQYALDKKNN
jgi:hypothetical protein